MRKILATLIILTLFSFGSAQASLTNNGNGLVYDTDLNVTWYTVPNLDTHVYADYATWAASLNVLGVTGWRLPTTPGTATGVTSQGEMGHLYTELATSSISNLFAFLQEAYHAGYYAQPVNGTYYYYDFSNGTQNTVDPQYWYFWIHGLAVHNGNIGTAVGIPSVPEPLSILLLSFGLAGIATIRKIRG